MKQYEVTFIVDPRLSGDEVKAALNTYVDLIKESGCEIVHIDEMGMKQLAYQINKRNTGHFFCIEYKTESGAMIQGMELAFRRDERILRFLTVALDKYGVKYNEDKRAGRIGKPRQEETTEAPKKTEEAPKAKAPAKEKKAAAPAKEEVAAVKEEAPAKEEAAKDKTDADA